jgi:hypothetical protein
VKLNSQRILISRGVSVNLTALEIETSCRYYTDSQEKTNGKINTLMRFSFRSKQSTVQVIFTGWHFNKIVYQRNIQEISTPVITVVMRMCWLVARIPITTG